MITNKSNWYRFCVFLSVSIALNQARRQDLAAGGPKTTRGHILKIQFWMYVATGEPNVKWGGRAPLSPRWRHPCQLFCWPLPYRCSGSLVCSPEKIKCRPILCSSASFKLSTLGVRHPSRIPPQLDYYSMRHSRSLMFLQLLFALS